ncbi:histone deacetylase family protein [Accumulibacter sp.]|uniref:histone deacetylase family protein n=1 Tax=Accumulibacter sp. TaxID=2053492 RepID=UPI0025D0F004|nr:histone deacetylase family protein [Accumulibacter sp.]MCM8596150.1 histone deacetylase family protein [Accumulibacter sp.]MCM8625584.1 histone deacetylase family protein [Accumulibacter sp.]MDS4050299.1 histone deacetylase family protein [Accumulibacter sp.]
MKVVWSEKFVDCYAADPAAEPGRMEAIRDVISDHVSFVEATPASEVDIARCHTRRHIDHVRRVGVYDIAALAAGGAIQAAEIGLTEPCFGLIRPPGHHASADSCWGFCYFNNLAIALEKLRSEARITRALVLDIDLHFGDGTVDILGDRGYAKLVNPSANSPADFIGQVDGALGADVYDIIAISAGFDYARDDWGRLLRESDYTDIGRMVRETARNTGAGFFAILEGGYNHRVLGHNCLALLEGLRED